MQETLAPSRASLTVKLPYSQFRSKHCAIGKVEHIENTNVVFFLPRRYGILIEQNYDGGDLKGSPTSGIPITDLTIENVSGSGAVSSSGYDVVIVCGSGSCSGWTWSDVNVTGGTTYSDCENVPSGIACS